MGVFTKPDKGLLISSLVFLLFIIVPHVNATHIKCGDEIDRSETLDSDLVGIGSGSCIRFVVKPDSPPGRITFDCAGHKITGNFADTGIDTRSRGGTIINCRISRFVVGIWAGPSTTIENNIIDEGVKVPGDFFSGDAIRAGGAVAIVFSNVIIRNNILKNGGFAGIDDFTPGGFFKTNNIISNNVIENFSVGIFLGTAFTSNAIINNNFIRNTTVGISAHQIDSSSIISNRIENKDRAGTGITLTLATSTTMTNNFINNYSTGISLLGTSSDVSVEKNIIRGGERGIIWRGSGSIKENYILENLGTSPFGINGGVVIEGQLEVKDNIVCANTPNDITNSSPLAKGFGSGNACGPTSNWNEKTAGGCTFKCGNVTGLVTDGHSEKELGHFDDDKLHGLREVKVTLQLVHINISDFANKSGFYSFFAPFDPTGIVPPLDANLRVDLVDKPGFIEVYNWQADQDNPSYFSTKKFKINAIKIVKDINALQVADLDPQNHNILSIHSADDLSKIYFYTKLAADFADEFLVSDFFKTGLPMDHAMPVEVYAFHVIPTTYCPYATGANCDFNNKQSKIAIRDLDSDAYSFNSPDNLEFHEFSHHIFTDSLIGGDNTWPSPSTPWSVLRDGDMNGFIIEDRGDPDNADRDFNIDIDGDDKIDLLDTNNDGMIDDIQLEPGDFNFDLNGDGGAPQFDAISPVTGGFELNHLGHCNPTTTDSWKEGFAEFMSMVISDIMLKDPRPHFYTTDSFSFDLENAGFKSWQDEELAIAEMMWDIYDGINPKEKDTIDDRITNMWLYLASSKGFKSEDRSNMYEVYHALLSDPLIGFSVDDLYIAHGFFNDTQPFMQYNNERTPFVDEASAAYNNWRKCVFDYNNDGTPELGAVKSRPDRKRYEFPPQSEVILDAVDSITGQTLNNVTIEIQVKYPPPIDTENYNFDIPSVNVPGRIKVIVPGLENSSIIIFAKKEGYSDSSDLEINSSDYWNRITLFGWNFSSSIYEPLANHTFILTPLGNDTDLPIISLISPPNNSIINNTNNITFLYNVSDATSGISICSLIINACVQPPPNMVGWWPGDSNANDLIDNNHGTLQNGTAFASGKVGQAFILDGIDDFVQVPDLGADLDGFSQLTIDAWINPDILGSDGNAIVSKYDSRINGISYWLDITPDGTLRIAVFERGGLPIALKGVIFSSSNATIPTDVFTHVAGIWKGSTEFELYVNGVQVPGISNVFDSGPTIMLNSNVDVNLGRFHSSSGNETRPFGHFKGILDEIEIYNRALAAEEIKAIFDAGNAGKCKSENNDIVLNDTTIEESTEQNFTQFLPNGIYSWKISCTDNSTNANVGFSEVRNIIVNVAVNVTDTDGDGIPDSADATPDHDVAISRFSVWRGAAIANLSDGLPTKPKRVNVVVKNLRNHTDIVMLSLNISGMPVGCVASGLDPITKLIAPLNSARYTFSIRFECNRPATPGNYTLKVTATADHLIQPGDGDETLVQQANNIATDTALLRIIQ